MSTFMRTIESFTFSLLLVAATACGDDTASSSGTSSGTASSGTASGTSSGTASGSTGTASTSSSSSGSGSTTAASGSSGDTGTASGATGTGSTGAGSTGAGSTGAGSTGAGSTGGGIQDCSLMPNACPMGTKCRVNSCCDQGLCVPNEAKPCGGLLGELCPDGLVCVSESCVFDAQGFCVSKMRADEILAGQPGCWTAG